MNITANGRTIEQVLGGGFFRVPRFQRPYSWDRANVEDFWLDVVESGTDYFIGSMVVYPQSEFSGLVDGQQRITTITMMLAAIRNELIGLGDTTAASGIQTLVERVHPKGKTRLVASRLVVYEPVEVVRVIADHRVILAKSCRDKRGGARWSSTRWRYRAGCASSSRRRARICCG